MKKETIIHSGQFMSSHVHEVKAEEEEEIDIVSDGVIEGAIKIVPDARDDNPVTFYKFGPKTSQSIAIDTSLTKLNKCIQFVYQEGKLYTPKWKHFQGLNIAWKDRVRLNNVIWRAWFLQFVRGVPPKYCFFSIPEEDMLHKPGRMFGNVFFRRTETVASQYLRWRRFYTKRHARQKMPLTCLIQIRLVRRIGNLKRSYDDHDLFVLPYSVGTPSFSAFEDDDLSNWFTDKLFSNLSQPYLFPNPKEMAGNADIIQPGLVQLQPSLEEIMRTFGTSDSFQVWRRVIWRCHAGRKPSFSNDINFTKPNGNGFSSVHQLRLQLAVRSESLTSTIENSWFIPEGEIVQPCKHPAPHK
ncbi:hypothetical protein TTRE_0000053001 [Trichuris trichiura]|uniref:Uncharacterized protein n=1 Tax=Trichuris trichiura TaxID=36087 RepID=A0A077YWV8_TRITR|nr:hypothetical protein TTRE_0000053001 [Trichuris trichiura]